jgi:hypothetical protein
MRGIGCALLLKPKEALNKSPTYEKIAAHALNTSEIKE